MGELSLQLGRRMASLCLEAWDEALNEIIKLSYEMIQKEKMELMKSMRMSSHSLKANAKALVKLRELV
ncbi:hypothetical protein DY000_02006352 [Brassica cretica]|uniref:Uncharacterized protein n=1 Tax=Brassica cretica TaxID=69181 RepID=A0ABQ7C148_BRACR|nr:hypothetical protein DY000_02006352 [Brassica cretica]